MARWSSIVVRNSSGTILTTYTPSTPTIDTYDYVNAALEAAVRAKMAADGIPTYGTSIEYVAAGPTGVPAANVQGDWLVTGNVTAQRLLGNGAGISGNLTAGQLGGGALNGKLAVNSNVAPTEALEVSGNVVASYIIATPRTLLMELRYTPSPFQAPTTAQNAWTRVPYTAGITTIQNATYDATTNKGVFSLPSGTYNIYAEQDIMGSGTYQINLRIANTSDSTYAYGTRFWHNNTGYTPGKVNAFWNVSISSTKSFEVQYYTASIIYLGGDNAGAFDWIGGRVTVTKLI